MNKLTGTAIESLPGSPAPLKSWNGVGMLTGGKGYVAAPLGQLHFRDIGPREPPVALLLLHQSPQSMVEFGAIQNCLAARGVRSVAVDTPGYGMSDQPQTLPTIGGFADNLLALLQHLRLSTIVAAGHHTGAAIATALAARHPDRVSGLILHGCPLYSPEEAAKFRAAKELAVSTPAADGSHLSRLFQVIPALEEREIFNRTWMSIGLFLQGADIGHWAVNRYDMAADLGRIRQPGLIISEVEDICHGMDRRARDLRPEFSYRVLAERGTSAIMTRPDDWADLAVGFWRSIGL